MKLTYPGPLSAVSVPSLGLVVKRGASVEVPEAAVAQLLEQGWTEPAKSPNTKKADPATTKEP